jgi:butyrate kinase
MDNYRMLIINPGSTSTKFSVFDNEKEIFSKSIVHTASELSSFATLMDQLPYRKEKILEALKEQNIPLESFSGVVGRGGIVEGLKTGGYIVDDRLVDELTYHPVFIHASNLGGLIAREIAAPLGIPAYIYDAVSSDELLPIAKVTGFKEITRSSFFHVLNGKAMSRKLAEKMGKRLEDCNFIVCHMGGGISMGAIEHGRIVDSQGDDAGTFAPDRSGGTNLLYVINMCYSGQYTKQEMLKKVRGNGGLKAHLGTHDCREIEDRIKNGDEHAKLIYEAMAYQIAKGIGVLMPVFENKVDAVILTGGMANSEYLTGLVKKRIERYLPVEVMPGENEMESLALGGLRILRGEEKAQRL